MNTEALTVTGVELVDASATDLARNERDALLQLVRSGRTITTPNSAQRASEILIQIKEFTRGIEDSRKAVKAPVLELSKRIDGLAGELTADLEAEAKRLSLVLGTYQAEQRRIAEAAQREAWEKERKIREAAEAEARAAEEAARKLAWEIEQKAREDARIAAEAARKEADAAAKAVAEATGAQARLEAEERAEAAQRKAHEDAMAREAELREERERAEARAMEDERRRQEETARKIVEARTAAAVVAPPKPEGISTRGNVKFEVTDIIALYEASPTLVLMSPNTAAIKAVLKSNPNQNLPGVRHWVEQAAIVR